MFHVVLSSERLPNHGSHHDCLRSHKSHSFGKEDADDAVTNTSLDAFGSTARHEAAGQWCRQTTQVLHPGGNVQESSSPSLYIERRTRLMRVCLRRLGRELCDMTTAPLVFKARTLKAEVIETLLYWWVCDVGLQHETLCQAPIGAPSPSAS